MHKVSEFIVKRRKSLMLLFAALMVCSIFTSGLTVVEDDLYRFLPDYTQTSKALAAMKNDFVTLGTARVIVRNVDYYTAQALCDWIESIDGVNSVSFDSSEEHYKNSKALIEITFDGAQNDEISTTALAAVKETLIGYDFGVDTQVGVDFTVTIVKQMLKVGTAVVAIVIILLLLTSRSYAEVPVLLITFVAAALIQIGSNFLFKSISYISNAVTLILQLALAIDYSVILCNRFDEEKRLYEPERAMVEALSKAMPEIASSSLTTVGGLVAMTFMQFTLGLDLGKVLIKSIVISMLTVFLLMPGLLLAFNRAIDASRHRSFVPRIDAIGSFAWKTRKIVPPLFIVLMVLGGYFALNCPFMYNYTDTYPVKLKDTHIARQEIIEEFGYKNMMALVVPCGDYGKEAQMLGVVSELEHVDSVLGLATVPVYADYRLIDEVTVSEFTQISGLDKMTAEAIFVYYGASHGDVSEVKSNLDSYKIEIKSLFLFLYDIVENGTENSDTDIEISAENKAMVEGLYSKLSAAQKQLEGRHYDRMLIYCDSPVQSEESYELSDSIRAVAESYYGDDVFVVGDTTCSKDLENTYTKDNLMITVLSAVLVVIVIMLTFRSVGLPILLIIVIQGSIWINFSVPYFTGKPLFFVAYLIVSAIQMGANIDYAIVVSNRYVTLRKTQDKREAITGALNGALPTLITSGSILGTAGLLIGLFITEATTSGIGISLGRGTFLSLFLVLFVLPQILLWGDRFIVKSSWKPQNYGIRDRLAKNDFEAVAEKNRNR